MDPFQPVDEVIDALATDRGMAKRPPVHGATRVANWVGLEGWGIDALVA